MKEKDKVLLAYVRQNSRVRLAKLSRLTGMPVSTIFDRLKKNLHGTITRSTVLLNWDALGMRTRALVLFKSKPEKRDELKEFLLKSPEVNTLQRINNGHDFIAECVFATIGELEAFLDRLSREYGAKTEAHYIIEDLAREAALTSPTLARALLRVGKNE